MITRHTRIPAANVDARQNEHTPNHGTQSAEARPEWQRGVGLAVTAAVEAVPLVLAAGTGRPSVAAEWRRAVRSSGMVWLRSMSARSTGGG
jgi:hypothetical protein